MTTEATNISLSTRFAQGAFWSLVGTVGARLSTFVGTVIVARLLGAEGFGELAMIQSTIGMLGVFAGLGIGMTATRYVAELRLIDPERTGRIIGLTYLVSWTTGGIMGLFCILVAPWIAAKTLNASHLIPEIRLASLLLIITSGFGPQSGILQGMQTFQSIAKITLWQSLASLPITVVLVWFLGLRGVILSLILNTLLGALLASKTLFYQYRSLGIYVNIFQAWQEKIILWKFSVPTFLATIVYSQVMWISNLILINQPTGYNELGFFNAAMQLQWMITSFNTIILSVSLPIFSELYSQGNIIYYINLFDNYLKLNWRLAIGLGFFSLSISPFILLIYGNNFKESVPIFVVTILMSVIYVANCSSYQVIFSSGLMWLNLWIHIFWGVILISLSYILTPYFKAFGLALSYLAAYLFRFLFEYIYIYIKHKISYKESLFNFFSYGLLCISAILLTNTYTCINLILMLFSLFLIGLVIKRVYLSYKLDLKNYLFYKITN